MLTRAFSTSNLLKQLTFPTSSTHITPSVMTRSHRQSNQKFSLRTQGSFRCVPINTFSYGHTHHRHKCNTLVVPHTLVRSCSTLAHGHSRVAMPMIHNKHTVNHHHRSCTVISYGSANHEHNRPHRPPDTCGYHLHARFAWCKYNQHL